MLVIYYSVTVIQTVLSRKWLNRDNLHSFNRQILVRCTKDLCSCVMCLSDGQQQSKAMLGISAAGAVKAAVTPLMAKIVAMDEKLEKVHNFMLKGPESVFKDIAVFAKEIFKCPICLTPPKDEIP